MRHDRLPPLRGWSNTSPTPRLTPWAAFFRASGAANANKARRSRRSAASPLGKAPPSRWGETPSSPVCRRSRREHREHLGLGGKDAHFVRLAGFGIRRDRVSPHHTGTAVPERHRRFVALPRMAAPRLPCVPPPPASPTSTRLRQRHAGKLGHGHGGRQSLAHHHGTQSVAAAPGGGADVRVAQAMSVPGP
jgi:hypothetical protein